MKTCPRCHLRYPPSALKCFVDGEELVQAQDGRIGTVLGGRYEIEEVLAQGGMAIVYVARHRTLNTRVAVKVLSAALERNKVLRERFYREAKATQKLAHPNIIEIMDHGQTEEGLPYLVMELLRGENMADAIARGKMAPSLALPIAVQIARALSRAHDLDVIHRDLKPENVFLCPGDDGETVAKLLDFGIARSLRDARITATGEVFGTPQYMAPERIVSIDAGPSADLYSLGVMMFEMLSGRLPFETQDVTSMFMHHMNKTPPTLREVGVDISERLSLLVASMLAKTENKRPVDAHAVHKELVEICQELGIRTPADPETLESVLSQHMDAPSTSIYQWQRRTEIFEQMLRVCYEGNPPAPMRGLFERIQEQVQALGTVLSQVLDTQRCLSELEAKRRTGRRQFGNAVAGLGVDASHAREQARSARERAEALRRETQALRNKAKGAHGGVLMWEGRSAFQHPYLQLAEAYRAAAQVVEHWWHTSERSHRAEEETLELDGLVSDLEYQINELRAGLQRLESSTEKERASLEAELTTLDRQATRLEQEVLALASRLCEPMRGMAAAKPLFRKLQSSEPSAQAS